MKTAPLLDLIPRQQGILREVLTRDGCSRSELHTALGLRKNTVTNDVALLIAHGYLREQCEVQGEGRSGSGRPRTPLEIDPDRLNLVGIAIMPGRVLAGRFNLCGQPLEPLQRSRVGSPDRLVDQAQRLLQKVIRRNTVAIGLSVPGFLDPEHQKVMLSAAWPGSREISLERLIARAGGRPVVTQNNLYALSAQWHLLQDRATLGDHLLVSIADGELGAAMMIDGRPNAGCLPGANELGHTRLEVPTPICYCGQTGCLERICSTAYLRYLNPDLPTLRQAIGTGPPFPKELEVLIERLASGIANAINFTRVGYVTLACDLGQNAERFTDTLIGCIRSRVLRELVDYCRLDAWILQSRDHALSVSALAMSRLYLHGW